MSTALPSLGAPEFSLELFASRRGPPSYWAYLTRPGEVAQALEEVKMELQALDEQASPDVVKPSASAAELLRVLPTLKSDVVLIGAEGYTEQDWATLDRRRSSLKRAEGVMVFVTTFANFDALMRVAPNLASWLGGFVFAHEDLDAGVEEVRARRLEALRSLFDKTDDQVIREAKEGRLPRDPEYAEWLTLLGWGELLDA